MEDFAGGHNYATIWTIPKDFPALRNTEKPETQRERERTRKGEGRAQCVACMCISVQIFSNATNVSISHTIIYVLADKRSDLFRYKPSLSFWFASKHGLVSDHFREFRDSKTNKTSSSFAFVCRPFSILLVYGPSFSIFQNRLSSLFSCVSVKSNH